MKINADAKPLVSVVIATYNRAALLGKALDSVFAQESVGELFDMEVIVVDDASSDGTAEVVSQYCGIRYMRLEINQGHAAARNAGIKASQGTYVTFLDSDDQWLPHKLRVQVPVLETRPDVGVVYGQSIVIDNGARGLRPDARIAPSGNVFRALLMKEFLSTNTLLIRREAFQMAGYFDTTLPTMGHYDMFLRLAFHVHFFFLPGAVAVGHVNKDGIFFSRLGGENGYVRTAPIVVERALNMLQHADDYAQVRKAVLESLVPRIFNWLGKIDSSDDMRSYLLTALKTYPWITTNRSVRLYLVRGITQVAVALARASDSPIATVRDFFAEVKSVVARQSGPRDWLQRQRLLAEAWWNVGGALAARSARHNRAAKYAVALAIFHDPSVLARRVKLNLLARAVFSSSRWHPICVPFTRPNKGVSLPQAAVPPRSAKATMQQEWSIGIYEGKSPLDLRPHDNAENPIVTRESVSDVQAKFVADPFMLRADANWYMFFEVWNRNSRKGEIGLAVSADGRRWKYRQIVLAEPCHLSYPYIFEWKNDYYMIPETHEVGCIRLYKATEFPTQWCFAGTLLSGHRFSDASIFRYNGKWWLFADTSPEIKHDTLSLYYADGLMGPWLEHARNPIIQGDPHVARPAGRVLVLNGKVIRFAQDCYPDYGIQVRAFEITELTPVAYSEQEVHNSPVLRSSGSGWNEHGMHHIDLHPLEDGRWIACVDGWSWKPASIETEARPAFQNDEFLPDNLVSNPLMTRRS